MIGQDVDDLSNSQKHDSDLYTLGVHLRLDHGLTLDLGALDRYLDKFVDDNFVYSIPYTFFFFFQNFQNLCDSNIVVKMNVLMLRTQAAPFYN